MRLVTAQTLALCSRRMRNAPLAVQFFLMALITKLRRLTGQQRHLLRTVSHMAGKTLPLAEWVMAAFDLALVCTGVTIYTYLDGGHGKHMAVFAGMRCVTLQAKPLGIRLMLAGHFHGAARMTG